MGRVEERSRKLTKRNRTQYLILESVKVAGLLSIALVAPNVLTGLSKLGVIASPRTRETAQRSYKRLVEAGLLTFEGKYLRLTEKGSRAYERMMTKAHAHRPRRWDGKWRVLIFDIPGKRPGLRDKVRTHTQHLGFVRLQDSVWAYPYDCEDLLVLLKADLRIGKDLLYMVVDSMEGDGQLRREFGLKPHA